MWNLKTMPDFKLSFSCTPTDTAAKCSGTESNGGNSSCCIRIEQERQAVAAVPDMRVGPIILGTGACDLPGETWVGELSIGTCTSIGSSSSLSAYRILTFIRSSSGLLMKETALALCSRAVLEQSVRAQSDMLKTLGASDQPRHPQLTSKVTG